MKEAVAVGIGIKDNHVIDDVNIYEATKLAMAEAIEKLSPEPEHLLIDAMTLDLPIGQNIDYKRGMLILYQLRQLLS